MRFHYWKHLIGVLFVALLIWITPPYFLAIDPLTLARSQNREISKYLNEAKGRLESDRPGSPTPMPAWLREANEHIDAALIVTQDQVKSLELAKQKSGPDLGSTQAFLASIVVIMGTLSTIILSWRKDMREARAELERVKSQTPRIALP